MGRDRSSGGNPASWRRYWTRRRVGWHLIGLCALMILVTASFEVARVVFTPLPIPIPTPACIRPELHVGSARFEIKTVARNANGTLMIPSNASGQAYWVEGTNAPYVLVLGPSAEDAAVLASQKPGDPVAIQWADCTGDEYVVSAVEAGIQGEENILAQSSPGILVYVPESPSNPGMTLQGLRPTAAPAFETEMPTAAGPQAEITFQDNAVSPDGSEIRMQLAVRNIGQEAFTIHPADISLAPVDGIPATPVSVVPALPVEVAPGESLTLAVAFANPHASAVVFKLLDFSVELYY
jgi:hypothetical protein